MHTHCSINETQISWTKTIPLKDISFPLCLSSFSLISVLDHQKEIIKSLFWVILKSILENFKIRTERISDIKVCEIGYIWDYHIETMIKFWVNFDQKQCLLIAVSFFVLLGVGTDQVSGKIGTTSFCCL